MATPKLTLGLLNYDEPYRAAMTALCAREHMMFLGLHGNAKSEFVQKFFGIVTGAIIWKTQMTKSSDESQIFGIPNIEKLLKGEVEYAEHIPALEADLWFVDEFFDAADVVMRSTLGIMNEREFVRGSTPRKVKLHSCIATANYTRANEITAAVIDRFVLTVNTPALGATERAALYDENTFKDAKKPSTYTLANFLAVEDHAKDVKISKAIVDALVEMCGPGDKRFNFSPRRERKLAKLIRVYAAIRGMADVTPECLEPFKWALPILVKEPERIEALKNLLALTGAFDKTTAQNEALQEAARLVVQEGQCTELARILKGVLTNPVNEGMRREAEKILNEANSRLGEPFQMAWKNA